MTRRRWIADEVAGKSAALTGAHAEHLIHSLRVKPGQVFDLATESGVYRAAVSHVGESRVEFALGEKIPASQFPDVTLALAIFKFDRMEWAIEKCTELGVARIVPVIASRSETHLASAAAKRVERWRRIVRQASEQSRRASPPEVVAPVKLKEAAALPGSAHIVLAEGGKNAMLANVLQSVESDDLVLAVGPEGGWTETEIATFRDAGWTQASLGRTILRAETAAIAAMASVFSHLQVAGLVPDINTLIRSFLCYSRRKW